MPLRDSQARDPNEPSNPVSAAVAHLFDASRSLSDAARCLQANEPERMPPRVAKRELPPEARITLKQLSALRVCSRRAGLSEKSFREMVAEESADATDVTELSKAEASLLLDRFNTASGFGR